MKIVGKQLKMLQRNEQVVIECLDGAGEDEHDGFCSASLQPRPQFFDDVAQLEDWTQLQSHVLHHHLAV